MPLALSLSFVMLSAASSMFVSAFSASAIISLRSRSSAVTAWVSESVPRRS